MVSTGKAFCQGFFAPWSGLSYMFRNKELWRYAALPIVLNLLITVLLLVLLFGGGAALLAWLHPQLPGGWLGVLYEMALVLALIVFGLATALVAWRLLQGVLLGYFYEKLAREVELKLGIDPEALGEVAMHHQLVDALRDVAALVGINLACLAVGCVPVVGSIVGMAAALYFNCYIFGRDYLDYPLALRGLRREEKLRRIRGHRAQALGLGAVVLLLNLVPFVGAVVLTTAAVGAVLLHRGWQDGPLPQPTMAAAEA